MSSVWQDSMLTSAAAVTITVGAEVVVLIVFTLETRKGPLWCRRVSSAVTAFTVPDPCQGPCEPLFSHSYVTKLLGPVAQYVTRSRFSKNYIEQIKTGVEEDPCPHLTGG